MAERLAEHGQAHRGGDHRVDDRDRGQRGGQARAPVRRLRQQRADRRQYRDRRHAGQRGERHAVLPVLRDGLGEDRGDTERDAGGAGEEHAAHHRVAVGGAGGRHQRDDRAGGDRGEQDPLPALQGPRLGTAGQREQPREAGRRHQGAAPGGRACPAAHEEGGHREREHDGQRAEGLHEAERAVGEGDDMEEGAEAVEADRGPPGGMAEGGVGAVGGGGGDAFLDDGAAGVGDGGDEGEQDGDREGAHEWLLRTRAPRGRCGDPAASMSPPCLVDRRTSSYLSTHWVLLPMEYGPHGVLPRVGDGGGGAHAFFLAPAALALPVPRGAPPLGPGTCGWAGLLAQFPAP